MSGNSLGVQWLETLAFHGRGHGFNSWWGTKIPQTLRCGQKHPKMTITTKNTSVPFVCFRDTAEAQWIKRTKFGLWNPNSAP